MRDPVSWRGFSLAVACASLLLGCTANRMHRPDSIEEHPDYSLAFIELDDQGELWAPAQLERALDLIERQNRRAPSGIALQLFVHGWNDSASLREDLPGDGTVSQFRKVLAKIHTSIANNGGGDVPVVGVYLSWRGQTTSVPLLRELSFYNRRGAAERIAGASATEVVYRILTTMRQNPASRSVLVGHSFGAAILEQALSQAIISSLLVAPGTEVRFPADLVVLINPASSASGAKQLVDILARNRLRTYRVGEDGRRYERPLLVSFTSEGDLATRRLFPLGMSVKSLGKRFRRYGPEQCGVLTRQRWLFTHTAGHTPGLISHLVTVGAKKRQEPTGTSGELGYRVDFDPVTRQVGFSFDGHDHRFTIVRKPRALNDTPYWIMQVPRELIPDHSTIFTDDTVALVEALFLFTGALEPETATILRREDGVRPVAVAPLPDGTAFFLDRSRGVFAVRRDSPRPLFLSCFSRGLDPSEAIGIRVAGETAWVAFRHAASAARSSSCQTEVYPFQMSGDSYRLGGVRRLSGSKCFAAASFDLLGQRLFLSSANSPAVLVADLGDRQEPPQPLLTIPGDELLTELLYAHQQRRLFALQGIRGRLWEVQLEGEAPQASLVSDALGRPTALAYDPGRSRLYVADGDGHRIWQLDCRAACREPTVFLRSELLALPSVLEVGLDGTLWLGDAQSQCLLAIAPSGEIVGSVRSLSSISVPDPGSAGPP